MVECPSCRRANDVGAKFCQECGGSLASGAQEQRKTVTVVFCDLAGSTSLGEALDPERLRALLHRYFEGMKTIVERHGGTVEKFIGDAVMAVFGVPVVHEDDALRAVRAAAEMRDALPGLGLEGRIGVMTGEVVTGTEERLVTGDAVNVAARLEQAAQPGEVLIGQPTLALVRDAVDTEAVEPLSLKGKAEPVAAYRLVGVHDVAERRHDAPFVGRQREIAMLEGAWERMRAEQRCELVTITGDAGVGKSRMVAHLLATVEATVIRGRCLPYGEGITYWPVVEILKQLDLQPTNEAAAAAIRSLLGQSAAPTSPEDIAWAFRKTLEEAAVSQPVVVVFDDIQWGEETLLDLIEHVALLSTGAAILLLCMARPELAESRPGWPVTLRLEPLPTGDVDTLIPSALPTELRERIARAASGNPLFVGEMLAMAHDAQGEVVVPPTLRALLAARLDQLEAAERGVLERGSIEGEVFHRGAVQALAPDETQITPRLAALVRKQLIRPDRPLVVGDDGFRFQHLLLRDAAYDALPKATRAELHEQFASWLEHHGTDLVELDELVAYHLEQVVRYRTELGLPIDARLAERARHRLTAAGRRARVRNDDKAAMGLFERATELVSPPAIDIAAETELVDALYWAGRGDHALARARSLTGRAAETGDETVTLSAQVLEGLIQLFVEPEAPTETLRAVVDQALPVLRAAGDDQGLYVAYQALGQLANVQGQMDAALDAYELATEHALRAGLPYHDLGWRSAFRQFGTTPASTTLEWLDANESSGAPNFWATFHRAQALAMLGRLDEAREILATARAALAERQLQLRLGASLATSAEIEFRAGNAAAAVEYCLEACRLYEQLGDESHEAWASAVLAQALYALGRLEEADATMARATRLSGPGDVYGQMLWRQVRAKVLAQRGGHAEAERLAREAVAIGEETDMLDAQGNAHADLADVLLLGGRPDEAAAALEQALALYERKGNLASADRTRARLAALHPETESPIG